MKNFVLRLSERDPHGPSYLIFKGLNVTIFHQKGIFEILTGKIDLDEGLIRPIKRKNDPVVGPDAMLVMIPSELDYLVKLSQAKKMGRFDMNSFDLYQTKDGTAGPLTLSGPFLGAPQAVIGMEKIVARGVGHCSLI